MWCCICLWTHNSDKWAAQIIRTTGSVQKPQTDAVKKISSKKQLFSLYFLYVFVAQSVDITGARAVRRRHHWILQGFSWQYVKKAEFKPLVSSEKILEFFYDRLIIKICLSNVQIRCLFVFGVWIGCNFTDQMINGMIQNWSHQIECILKVPSERRFFSNLYLYYQESLEHVSCDSSPLYVCFVSSDVSVFVVFVVRWQTIMGILLIIK